jgi:dTDP-glucose 4,6-dehydratase
MRVVITGAAGFLGSHLTDRFLADGHEVLGVDNFLTGEPRNVAHLAREPRFDLLEQDVSRGLDVAGRVDGVLHLASPASPVDYYEHPIATLDVGSAGTRHALALTHAHGARFLLASTSEVYGDPHVHPQPESYWGHVNSVGPRSCYDEAKRFAEAMTMAFHRAHGVDTRIVRIFNTYGPRMRPRDGRVVSNFIVQALRGEPLTMYGDGAQTRSFCYATDEAEGLYRLFMRAPAPDAALPTNIGNPDEFTVRQLAEQVIELVARRGGPRSGLEVRPLPEDDPKQRRPDITRARATLGWEPTVPLREGLVRTVAYFAELLAADGAHASRTLDDVPSRAPISLEPELAARGPRAARRDGTGATPVVAG